jgi:hypothetical protein
VTILSLYGIPDKYIKLISAMCKNNIAAVKVGNEASSWFCIKSGFCAVSSVIWIILKNFVPKSTAKAI